MFVVARIGGWAGRYRARVLRPLRAASLCPGVQAPRAVLAARAQPPWPIGHKKKPHP